MYTHTCHIININYNIKTIAKKSLYIVSDDLNFTVNSVTLRNEDFNRMLLGRKRKVKRKLNLTLSI